MKFNQLRDFVAAAETGSLRGAARRLGLAQPAISRSIQELEHGLGAQLFVRGARGVSLTPVGQTFLTRAIIILEEVRRSREEVSQLIGSDEGELVVGLSIAAHLSVFSKALQPFTRRYPNVRLRIIEGFLPTLEDDLGKGLVDFFVGPVAAGTKPRDLIVEKLFDNERLVIGRPGHPLSGATDIGELRDAKWLTTSITHNAEDELRAVFSDHSLPPPVLAARCQSALSILTVLVNSDALAMVPRQWVESPMLRGLVARLPLRNRFAASPIVLVYRAGLSLTPAAEHFVSIVKRLAAADPVAHP